MFSKITVIFTIKPWRPSRNIFKVFSIWKGVHTRIPVFITVVAICCAAVTHSPQNAKVEAMSLPQLIILIKSMMSLHVLNIAVMNRCHLSKMHVGL